VFWNEKILKSNLKHTPKHTHFILFLIPNSFIPVLEISIQLHPTHFILFLRHFVLRGCYRYTISYNFQPGFTLKIKIIYYEGIVGACSSTSIPDLSTSRGYIDVVTYTNLFSS